MPQAEQPTESRLHHVYVRFHNIQNFGDMPDFFGHFGATPDQEEVVRLVRAGGRRTHQGDFVFIELEHQRTGATILIDCQAVEIVDAPVR